MTDVLLDQLDPYRAAGWDLIPLNRWDYRDQWDRERGKSPLDRYWGTALYQTEAVFAQAREGFNVGVRLRDFDLVIDYDPRNAPAGRDVVFELQMEYGIDLSTCPCVITGGGGRHWYLRKSPGKIRNELLDFPGIEFKSLGRQVVAAGSKHPNGTNYRWAEDSRPLPEAPEAPPALLAAITRPERTANVSGESGELTLDEIKHCLSQLPVEEYRGKHDAWLEVLMACHAASRGSDEACEAFVEWSTSDPMYAEDADDHRYRWQTFDPDAPGGVRAGTLFHHVIEHGGQLPRPSAVEQFADVDTPVEPEQPYFPVFETVGKTGVPKNSGMNAIEAIKALGLQPEWDVFSGRAVLRGDLGPVREMYPTATEVWDENLMHALWHLCMVRWRFEPDMSKLRDAIRAVAIKHPFNPVAEFLNGLEWDGVPRLDTWLTEFGGAKDTPYIRATGRMLLLAAVGRALVAGIKYDNMVVIEGPQGSGKSSLVKVLGGEAWTLEEFSTKNPSSPDAIAALRGKWLVEMAELTTMRKADSESLKAFLSVTEDRCRMPYERNVQDFPRRCVFIGTTNDAAYLRDTTGNRRFFPVALPKIDLDGLRRARNQLWAEARIEWEKNPTAEGLQLPSHLWADAAAEQEERRLIDPVELALENWLWKNKDETQVSTQTLLFELFQKTPSTASAQDCARLRALMEKAGWESKQFRQGGGNAVRGYRRRTA